MKRILTILALVAIVAGCASRTPSFRPTCSAEGEYLRGFVDGYLSAYPDKPYAKDVRAYRPGPPFRRTAYAQGWHAGHQTGRKDERQRD